MDDDGGGDGDDDYDNDNEDNDNDDNDDDGEDDDDARRTASAHCWIVCHIATREIRREREAAATQPASPSASPCVITARRCIACQVRS